MLGIVKRNFIYLTPGSFVILYKSSATAMKQTVGRQVGEVRDHGRRLKTHLFTRYDSAHKAQ